MKITPDVLRAYNNTLAKAITHGKSDFQCSGLECGNCPFRYSECCDVGVKSGGGELRTFTEWKKWFENLYDEQDNRSQKDVEKELGLSKQDTADSSPTTFYTVSRTTLHVEAPVERQVSSFEYLLAELDEFKKDITAWVQVMQRNASEISIVIPDYMEFHATDAEGTSVIDWAMDAGDFGKKKVWINA